MSWIWSLVLAFTSFLMLGKLIKLSCSIFTYELVINNIDRDIWMSLSLVFLHFKYAGIFPHYLTLKMPLWGHSLFHFILMVFIILHYGSWISGKVNSIHGTLFLIISIWPILESNLCLPHIKSMGISCLGMDATSILLLSYFLHSTTFLFSSFCVNAV